MSKRLVLAAETEYGIYSGSFFFSHTVVLVVKTKATLHGGQPRSWPDEQGTDNIIKWKSDGIINKKTPWRKAGEIL